MSNGQHMKLPEYRARQSIKMLRQWGNVVPKTKVIQLRVTAEQFEIIKERAKAQGLTVTDLILKALNV